MKSHTQSVTINLAPHRLYDFLAKPENLPKWAIFCHGIRFEKEKWIANTDHGEVDIAFVTDSQVRVIDFVISTGPGVALTSYSRVLANDTGAEYLFTHFQPSNMSDDVYQKQVIEPLEEELLGLKKLMETGAV
jgi:hypothetical protein